MTMRPLLASDTTAALVWPVVIVLGIGLIGLAGIVAIAKWGRRRRWGLVLALFPTTVGGLSLLLLVSARALPFLCAVAAFPLLCGLIGLYFWSRKEAPSPELPDKMREAIEMSQQEAIAAAEAKLGRSLTEEERAGIRRIRSLMMLESCCRAFRSQVCTPTEVSADLQHFAKQTT